jgi:pimeloyl-ACP methyl ester carboxylesterase
VTQTLQTGTTTDGTYYQLEGQGPKILVLIHGVGLDLTVWDGVVEQLHDQFRILRYDMLCHGRSPLVPDSLSLGGLTTQLDELLVELDLSDVILGGFSMGGLVSLAYAIEKPIRLNCMVIMNATYKRPDETQKAINERLQKARREGPSTIIDAAIQRWFTEPFQDQAPPVIEATRKRLMSNDPDSFLAAYDIFVNQGFRVNNQLHNVEVPSLVITSEFDQNSTPEMAEIMASEIPNGRAVVVPELKHMAPAEDPETYARLILEFVEE